MRHPRSLLLFGAAALLILGASPSRAEEDEKALRFPDTPVKTRVLGGTKRSVQVHDYGTVAQHAELTATIPYRNAGSQPIEGLRVKSGCSCFGATLSDRSLAPGAAGTLTVRFRSATMKGSVEKPLHLLYKAGGAQAVAELRLSANVTAGVLVERVWFGEVRAGTKPTASAPVAWFEGVGKAFKITKIDVPGPKVATRIEPYAAGRGSTYRGWTVHYTFLEAPPKGIYSRRATLHTTHPDHPTVIVPLSATVVGAVWVQSSRIYLGLIPAGEARSASVAIKASGKEPPPLLNVRVKARKGGLQISVKDGFDPFKGAHKVITVTVPKGTPPGLLDDVLEIRTGAAGGEVTEIQVLGRIYKPVGNTPRRGR